MDSARTQLIEKHLPLVESVARRFSKSSEPHEDLVQVGTIGLIKAVDRFEPERGHRLSTVAVPAIEGEIRHYLRDRAELVRTPRRVRELATKMRRKERQLTARLGREPTTAELAKAVGASAEEVIDARTAALRPTTLDGDAPASPRVGTADQDASEARLLLGPGWAALPERQRAILELRYHEDLSQTEIARRVGLSQATVSRLLGDAIDRLRASLERDGAVEAPAVQPPVEAAAAEAAPADAEARDTATVAEPPAGSYSRSVATPEPQPTDQRPSHSGRLLVRMPSSLHGELARVAEREGVSLNTLVTGALAGAVGWRDPDGGEDGEPTASVREQRPTWLRTALIANLVVVALAAIAAIALLIAAWSSGW